MGKADEYRARAEETGRLARQAPDEQLRAEYERLSKGWADLAEQQARQDAASAPQP